MILKPLMVLFKTILLKLDKKNILTLQILRCYNRMLGETRKFSSRTMFRNTGTVLPKSK